MYGSVPVSSLLTNACFTSTHICNILFHPAYINFLLHTRIIFIKYLHVPIVHIQVYTYTYMHMKSYSPYHIALCTCTYVQQVLQFLFFHISATGRSFPFPSFRSTALPSGRGYLAFIHSSYLSRNPNGPFVASLGRP